MVIFRNACNDDMVTIRDIYNAWTEEYKGNGDGDGDSFAYFVACLMDDVLRGRTDLVPVHCTRDDVKRLFCIASDVAEKFHPELWDD